MVQARLLEALRSNADLVAEVALAKREVENNRGKHDMEVSHKMLHGGLAVLRKSMAAMYFFCSSGLLGLPALLLPQLHPSAGAYCPGGRLPPHPQPRGGPSEDWSGPQQRGEHRTACTASWRYKRGCGGAIGGAGPHPG